jgi:hypothetical protein
MKLLNEIQYFFRRKRDQFRNIRGWWGLKEFGYLIFYSYIQSIR